MPVNIVRECDGFGGFLGHMPIIKTALLRNCGIKVRTANGDFLFVPVKDRQHMLINPELENTNSTTSIILRRRTETLEPLREKKATLTILDHGRPVGVFIHQAMAKPESYSLNISQPILRQGVPAREVIDTDTQVEKEKSANTIMDLFQHAVQACGTDGTGNFSITTNGRKYTLLIEAEFDKK